MRELVARGYCKQQSFVFRPHNEIEIVSKIVSGQEQLHVKIGEINIRMTRKQWSRETDHWHETDYLCYRATIKLGETVLADKQVAEFLLQLDGDTLVLGLRKAPSVRADQQSSSSGHSSEVHLITKAGLYRKLEEHGCSNCEIEEGMTRAMYGCNKCLTRHMHGFKKEPV